VLGNLGLALLENRVPVWLRTGVAGLGLGALLLGLVWPYITLPALGTGPGAIIAGIGAAALVVSGLLALVTDRHAKVDRPV
jgi:predicted membrane-bound spermidine synthase